MAETPERHPAEAWAPASPPQIAFATTEADVAIIGGSPGGGKTVACLYECAKLTMLPRARRVRATCFRRQEVSLLRGGSIWDRAKQMLPAFGGIVRNDALSVVFEASSGAIEDQHRIDFRHLASVDSVRSYDGSEQDLIVFEEIQEFEEVQVMYMLSRLRSLSGVRPRMRASCNPEPDSWLCDLLLGAGYIGEDGYIRPEMSGVVRWFVRDETSDEIVWFDTREEALEAYPELEEHEVLSFTFVLARLSDNQKLKEHDPGYRGRIRALPRKDRVRLIGEGEEDRGGCWFSTEAAGDFFAKDALKLSAEPPAPVLRWVRAWDFGSSEPTSKEPNPDWTEGARVALCAGGLLWIDALESAQLGPIATTELVIATAKRDGPLVEVALFQDSGSAGKRDAATMKWRLEREQLTVHIVHSDRRIGDEKGDVAALSSRSRKRARSSAAKQALARPWAMLAQQGRVYMRPAPWNKKLVEQAYRFPNALKDDAIDAVSCAVAVLAPPERGTSLIEAMEALRS